MNGFIMWDKGRTVYFEAAIREVHTDAMGFDCSLECRCHCVCSKTKPASIVDAEQRTPAGSLESISLSFALLKTTT